MTHALLQVTHLSCARSQKKIVADVSFSLNAGDALLITGDNGAGKSSLLRLLAGIATPTSGTIDWCIHPTELHYISHSSGIKLGLTVKENLQLLSHVFSQSMSASHELILSTLQLTAHANTKALHLSAGQKRKLSLAKLFIFPKKIWLLDEPLTSLDATTSAYFLQQLQQHLEAGGLAIISTHQPISLVSNTKNLRLSAC